MKGGVGIAWRYGLANVARRGRDSAVQVVAFGLGLTALVRPVEVDWLSHVGAGLYLSEMDQEFADNALFPFPEAAQIVLAVAEGRVVGAAIFERTEDGKTFQGRLLQAGDV